MKRPLSVLAKPTSSRCNLNCSYCFYLRKAELYPWADHPKLSLETLELFSRQYVEGFAPPYGIAWQGGEPTMMGLSFYEEVIELQKRLRGEFRHRPVFSNSIQTNGTLINDDWARFFKAERFLVGVSIDGPPDLHDTFRVDWKDRPSHARVLDGVQHLRSRGVEFNVLTVVNSRNVEHPEEVLQYLVRQRFEHLQFIPCAEPPPGHAFVEDYDSLPPGSITPQQYGKFLTGLFDAWVKIGIDKVRVRWFDNLVQMLWGQGSEMCELATECGYVVLENNGDCYPCDFFVENDWLLGNVHDSTLAEMMAGGKFRLFASMKGDLHPDCLSCEWRSLCQGECPRYRITNTGFARGALPYFCPSFKEFFGSKYGRLEQLAVSAGRAMSFPVPAGRIAPAKRTAKRLVRGAPLEPRAALGGAAVAAGVGPAPGMAKTGRNDPCPCGSGRKYKRCHGGSRP